MPGYLPSANQALRGNPRHLQWQRRKARDAARQAFLDALPASPSAADFAELEGPFVLGFERRTCQPMDLRNLSAAYKALEDQVVESGFLPDDTPDIVVATPVRQVRVRKRNLTGSLLVLAPDREEWAEARATLDAIFE